MYKLSIVGVGKMGSAILTGILKSNLYTKSEILLVVHSKEQQEKLEEENFNATLDVKEAYINSQIILMAVKPQKFAEVLVDSKNFDFSGKCIISIAAGIDISVLKNYFSNAYVFRAMPNTSATICKSVTTICVENTNNHFYNESLNIIKSFGTFVEIKEEEMDYTLPLNGSMPAYLYYFIKSFIDAAILNGVDEEKAKSLVIDTIISSTIMLKTDSNDLDTLINNVCSKGGTTIAGLTKLKEQKVNLAIKSCYDACKNRSIELRKGK